MNGKHHFYGSPYKILKKFFPGKTKKPCEILSDYARATGWFYSVFFTSRCDKAFQMKEIGRISADIVAQRSLKVVPELSPVKTIWLGQVEPEQDKKKNPGKPHGSGVFWHFEVLISAC